jgi:hypothetical protein
MRALELLPFSFLDPRQHPPSLPRHVHSTLPSKPAKARGEPNRLIVVTYSNSVRSRRSWLAPLTPCHMSASHHTRAYIALISDSVFQITLFLLCKPASMIKRGSRCDREHIYALLNIMRHASPRVEENMSQHHFAAWKSPVKRGKFDHISSSPKGECRYAMCAEARLSSP